MSEYFLGGPDAEKLKDAMYDKVYSKIKNPPSREELDEYSIGDLFTAVARQAKWPLPEKLGRNNSHYKYDEPSSKNIPKEVLSSQKSTTTDKINALDHFLNGEKRDIGSRKYRRGGLHRYGNTNFIHVSEHTINDMLDWIAPRVEGKEVSLDFASGHKDVFHRNISIPDYYEQESQHLKEAFCEALKLNAEQFKKHSFIEMFEEIENQVLRNLSEGALPEDNLTGGGLASLVARHKEGEPLNTQPDAALSHKIRGMNMAISYRTKVFDHLSERKVRWTKATSRKVFDVELLTTIGNAIREMVPEALVSYDKSAIAEEDLNAVSVVSSPKVDDKSHNQEPLAIPVVTPEPERRESPKHKTIHTEEKEKQLLDMEAGGITITLTKKSLPTRQESADDGALQFYVLKLTDNDGVEANKYLNATSDAKVLRMASEFTDKLDTGASMGIRQAAALLNDMAQHQLSR